MLIGAPIGTNFPASCSLFLSSICSTRVTPGEMKSALAIAALLALLAITIGWAIHAWNAVDVEMSVHGYIAMILGIFFSFLVGFGLMALVFYSNRRGSTTRRT